MECEDLFIASDFTHWVNTTDAYDISSSDTDTDDTFTTTDKVAPSNEND